MKQFIFTFKTSKVLIVFLISAACVCAGGEQAPVELSFDEFERDPKRIAGLGAALSRHQKNLEDRITSEKAIIEKLKTRKQFWERQKAKEASDQKRGNLSAMGVSTENIGQFLTKLQHVVETRAADIDEAKRVIASHNLILNMPFGGRFFYLDSSKVSEDLEFEAREINSGVSRPVLLEALGDARPIVVGDEKEDQYRNSLVIKNLNDAADKEKLVNYLKQVYDNLNVKLQKDKEKTFKDLILADVAQRDSAVIAAIGAKVDEAARAIDASQKTLQQLYALQNEYDKARESGTFDFASKVKTLSPLLLIIILLTATYVLFSLLTGLAQGDSSAKMQLALELVRSNVILEVISLALILCTILILATNDLLSDNAGNKTLITLIGTLAGYVLGRGRGVGSAIAAAVPVKSGSGTGSGDIKSDKADKAKKKEWARIAVRLKASTEELIKGKKFKEAVKAIENDAEYQGNKEHLPEIQGMVEEWKKKG